MEGRADMGLNDMVVTEARPFPIFLLVDTSGSMKGPKIDTVNTAIREMQQILSNLKNTRGPIKLSIIGFDTEVKIIQALENIENISLDILVAKGKTAMGSAINKLVDLIEDKDILSSRAHSPIIILISDGLATDCNRGDLKKREDLLDYSTWEPILRLQNSERARESQKLVLSVGDDADKYLLKAFINNENIPIIKANQVETIDKFFKWVTKSVSAISTRGSGTISDFFPLNDSDFFDLDEREE